MELETLRAQAAARVRDIERELVGIRAARSDGTADDEHDPEGSTLTEDWSRAVGLRADAERRLDEVDAAIARRENGTYGICESCHRDIPAARLEVRPTATRCVSCS